ncbi:hypothetical protein [Synechococcus sp. M16CYN]|uniref:hypothetical protein n=1 Tax=Synechococcus sp. M16CYN TaxID=3103139 RepID=UPI0032472539
MGSMYRADPITGELQVQHSTIPGPSLQVDDEARRLSRRIYWGLFFSLPEKFVMRMPIGLLSNDIRGRFPLKLMHQWAWYLIRPFWAWPPLLMWILQLSSRSDLAKRDFWLALETTNCSILLQALEQLRLKPRRDLIERLLFQRNLRPRDINQQKKLFTDLFYCKILEADQRTYAGVALG